MIDLPTPTDAEKAAYRKASPFPHAVLEGLFPSALLEKILAEFPSPKQVDWIEYDTGKEKKLGMKVDNKIGELSRSFLHFLNSAPVIRYLEDLTGIEGLIPDPYYHGGGFHQIQRGGFLKIHADFNWHRKLKLHRRINLLIYLNQDWKDEYGGHLELWDKETGAQQKKILPLFGRCVIFNTTDFAFHGHPEPLNCPEGSTRKSIALYYYSSSRPKEELSDAHTTLWMKRNDAEWKDARFDKVQGFLDRITPPIFGDIARAYRKRARK